IAADILDNKLELARQFGATHTINSKQEDLVSRVKELTGGLGVDYSFEVIASVHTIRQAFEALAPDGLCTVVGAAPPGSEVPIPTDLLFFERAIRGVFLGSTRPHYDVPRLVDLYMAGKIKLDELVSQTMPIEGINQAFDDMKAGKVARTVITYS
ncbi:MAG TPA: zinc-binding dehydrogenase, partial [Dehalococcoidia bacterium]|nr:zinc-binding dehydrogenase [Dehalococcoidia bacterium]